jgi:Metallo-beta-lactamase superfamily
VLRQVAEGVLIHESEFCQSNAIVVQGRAGALLIDPGVLGYEMAALANDLRELGQPVVTGFSTHPHWDHLLWHTRLGAAPRYGTARCAATVRDRLSDARWKARIAELIPPDIADQGTAGPARRARTATPAPRPKTRARRDARRVIDAPSPAFGGGPGRGPLLEEGQRLPAPAPINRRSARLAGSVSAWVLHCRRAWRAGAAFPTQRDMLSNPVFRMFPQVRALRRGCGQLR